MRLKAQGFVKKCVKMAFNRFVFRTVVSGMILFLSGEIILRRVLMEQIASQFSAFVVYGLLIVNFFFVAGWWCYGIREKSFELPIDKARSSDGLKSW